MSADRLVALESLHAEQEKVIEELSGEVARQWQAIDRLEKSVAALAERFVSLESRAASDTPVTRPPHW